MKINKIFNRVLFLGALAMTMTACDKDVFDINADPFKDQTFITELYDPTSIEIEKDGRFTEYTRALYYADMYNALNQYGQKYTAFVPTDSAMVEFYKSRGVTALEQLPASYVKEFIKCHTHNGDSLLPEKFIMKNTIDNICGDELSIEIDSVNPGQALLGGAAQIIEMGKSASNGKIYVITSTLTPLVETVYDRVVEQGKSTVMIDALNATGWAKKLQTVEDTTKIDGITTITRHFYTLLNVEDNVFAKAGINSLTDLKKKLKEIDEKGLSDDSLLMQYVGYHIMPNSYTISSMEPTLPAVSRLWDTSSNNTVISILTDTTATDISKRNTLNAEGVSAEFIIENSDIKAKNGYVHHLTSWLPVWEPKQEIVIWDFADYAEIKSLVPSTDYQPLEAPAAEGRYRIATATSVFTYEMGESGSSNNKYSDIDYVPSKVYSKVNAVNNDRVVFNVGYMGFVQMATPTLVKGKYMVELTITYLPTHQFMKGQTGGSNGGLIKVSFDDDADKTVFVAPYTKVTGMLPGYYTSTIYEEVEFTETGSHNFKFVVLDPTASTNANFSLQFDCIKFTPITE